MGSRLLLLTDLNGRLQQVNALEITPDRSMIAAAGEPARPPAAPGTGDTGHGRLWARAGGRRSSPAHSLLQATSTSACTTSIPTTPTPSLTTMA